MTLLLRHALGLEQTSPIYPDEAMVGIGPDACEAAIVAEPGWEEALQQLAGRVITGTEIDVVMVKDEWWSHLIARRIIRMINYYWAEQKFERRLTDYHLNPVDDNGHKMISAKVNGRWYTPLDRLIDGTKKLFHSD